MASTNEDVVVLAKGRTGDDARLLVIRHLPDRGTIELGWWGLRDGAPAAESPVLEFPAEATELDDFERLCVEAAAAAGGDPAGQAVQLAVTPRPSAADGARIVAETSGVDVALVRRPGRGDDRIVLTRDALRLVVAEMLPAARARLATLGFGLPQQEAAPNT